ncbi:MAG: DUF5697 family protein [Lachnospiraceae bacterium]|nr:DUF5697 family protein [Lachnospiraceae bacterium]
MKTRNQIYNGDGALLLRIISTYHALRYDQIMQLFSKSKDSMKALITKMIKQGRIYHDKDTDLLCDTPQSAESPDYGVIAAFWVLLDFKKAVMYHTSGDFPIKLHFFSQEEAYEIIYVGLEQEALVNHIMQSLPPQDALRIVILENKAQAAKVSINGVIAFCIVDLSGTVSYYKK